MAKEFHWPIRGSGGGSSNWLNPVGNPGLLPSPAEENSIAYVESDNSLYIYQNGNWEKFYDGVDSLNYRDADDLSAIGALPVFMNDNKTITKINRILNLSLGGYVKVTSSGIPSVVFRVPANEVATGAVDNTTFNYLNGVTSGIQSQLDGKLPSSARGAVNGVASLDANQKIPNIELPALAITDTFVAADQDEQEDLDAQQGDVCVRTDISTSFILVQEPASNFGNWQELLTPGAGVTSVNGMNGVVLLDTDDIAEGSSNLYFTDTRAVSALKAVSGTDRTEVFANLWPLGKS